MKHLLITGASGNLGIELIPNLELFKFDKIYLVGNEERLKNLNLNNEKINLISNIDLTDETNVAKLFEQIKINSSDSLFVIHLVGGYAGGKFFWEFSKEELQSMIEKNLLTSFLISKYATLKASKSNGGSIIFISAKLSLKYEPKRSIYSISKSALNFLVKVIAEEAKPLNFTANAIAPYLILTDENKKWLSEKEYSLYIAPAQIANLINSIFHNYQKINGNIFLVND